jgi:hypothetical protein
MFGTDSGTIEIVEDVSTISDQPRPILGIMTRDEPDFPLCLQKAVADDLAAGWSELTSALALSKCWMSASCSTILPCHPRRMRSCS